MKYFLSLLLLTSCANIQYLTNTNVGNIHGLSTNEALREKYDAIKEITAKAATQCKSLGKITANDNAFDAGERYAILYLKGTVRELKGDSVVVLKKEKVGDYGHTASGEAFLCGTKVN